MTHFACFSQIHPEDSGSRLGERSWLSSALWIVRTVGGRVPNHPSGSDPGSHADLVSLMGENTVIVNGSGGGHPAYVSHGTGTGSFGSSDGASMLQVWGEANKYVSSGTSSWDVPSDIRYKSDVKPFTVGLDLLKKINPVKFHYYEKLGIPVTEEGIGVIAQEIQSILPYTVHEGTLVQSKCLKPESRVSIDGFDTLFFKVPDFNDLDSTGKYRYKDSTSTIFVTKCSSTQQDLFRLHRQY